jgi:hypothetical protein
LNTFQSRNGTVRLSLEQARPTLPPRARSPWRRPRWGRGINAGLADLFPPASADAATTAPPSDSNTPSDIVEVAPSDTPAPSDHSDEFEPHQSRTLLSTPRLQQEDGELFFPYEQVLYSFLLLLSMIEYASMQIICCWTFHRPYC